MHPDHIGGLMEDGKPAFPNARYVTGQAEYDFWAADKMKDNRVGELGLDGTIAPVSGVLPMAMDALSRGLGVVCPAANGGEAA